MGIQRQAKHQRNTTLEALLTEINQLLSPVEQSLMQQYETPQYPPIFVVGMPRGGTTLLMQWLAQTSYFAYPTNLLSRFYNAPAVGAKIQQLLTNPAYNFRDELYDLGEDLSFSSSLGKTKGSLQPNEFWYFWRRFIPNKLLRQLNETELAQVDVKGFRAEMAAIEAVFDKPVALKALILQLNIPFLAKMFENAIFLYVKRHPFYNIQSLLEARENYFGDRQGWYSIKPKEYDTLQGLDPIAQVAGQVYFTLQGIEAGLQKIDTSRFVTIGYEQFCANPRFLFEQLVDRFSRQGFHMDWTYDGVDFFEHTNQVRVDRAEVPAILNAYQRFSGQELHLT